MPTSGRTSRRTLAVSVGFAVALVAAAPPSAHAEVVPVDPGRAITAGKPISGTGQNLPSMGSAVDWNIGSWAATQVNDYYTSGRAAKDQADIARAALTWTRQWVKEVCGETQPAKVRRCKVAAVFDIDDTLESNYPVLAAAEPAFTYSGASSYAAESTCAYPVIPANRRLFSDLHRMGLTVFLITGRAESERNVTIACLNAGGITGWQGLIMRPPNSTVSAAVYKSVARARVEKQGWTIGPSIGDQVSDMSLGHLEHGFLVPNPMYYLP